MVLRWIAAGMGEAAKQFRRVNGYLHLPALRVALGITIDGTKIPLALARVRPRTPRSLVICWSGWGSVACRSPDRCWW